MLLSWTGTMFEYLMPSLWMRIVPKYSFGAFAQCGGAVSASVWVA